MRSLLVLFALVAFLSLVSAQVNTIGFTSIPGIPGGSITALLSSILANLPAFTFPTVPVNPFAGTIGGGGLGGVSFGVPVPAGGFPGVPAFALNANATFQFGGTFLGLNGATLDANVQARIPHDIPALGNNPALGTFLANLLGNYIGTPVPIAAINVAQNIPFFLGPNVTVSATAPGSITVSLAPPQAPGSAALPDGFQALRANGTALFGYTIAFSGNGTVSGTFITGPLDGFLAIFQVGAIGVLTVTNGVYTRIAADQVTILQTGQVSFPFTSVGDYFILNLNLVPTIRALGQAATIAAFSGQSLSFGLGNNGGNGGAAVNITNIQAAAGQLFASISAQATVLQAAAVQAGLASASQIFNFTHTAGAGAITSATLAFDITLSTNKTIDPATLAWFKFDVATNAWVKRGGVLNGTILSFTTNGFSDWTVAAGGGAAQGNNNGGKNAATQVAPSIIVFATVALAAILARFF